MHETCLIIIHDPGMRTGPESNNKLKAYNYTVRFFGGVGADNAKLFALGTLETYL